MRIEQRIMKDNKTTRQIVEGCKIQGPIEIVDRLGTISGFSILDGENIDQAANRIEAIWKGMHPIPISCQAAGGVGPYLAGQLNSRGYSTVKV